MEWITVKIGKATHQINPVAASELTLAEFKAAHPYLGDYAKDVHSKAVKMFPKSKEKK